MCTSPLILKVSNARHNHKWVTVGCGKCDDCKRRYQNDWSIRLANECECWSNVWFITLTYRPESVPYVVDSRTGELHNSVCKEHVQKWLKRFRINFLREYGEIVHLKYFLTSEYGPRTLRPHYHMLLFGLDLFEVNKLCDIWNDLYGFTLVKKLDKKRGSSFAVSRYVAKYCSKGSFENPYVAKKLVKPTFHLISKGIGYKYVIDYKNFHLQLNEFSNNRYTRASDGSITFNPVYIQRVTDLQNCQVVNRKGKVITFAMPRYYKEKIYGVQNSLSDAIADEILLRAEQLRDQRAKELQTMFPDWSFDKAYGYTFYEDSQQNLHKIRELQQTFSRFYDQSRL